MPDFKDLVIEELAESEAGLKRQVESVEYDVMLYREIAQSALRLLRETAAERDAARRMVAGLKEEYAAFRVRMLASEVAA